MVKIERELSQQKNHCKVVTNAADIRFRIDHKGKKGKGTVSR